MTSAAARLSPQTCFPPSALLRSLPLPAAMPTRPAMPAAVTSSPSPWPPFPWLADYRCQSADAELPPVRLPNPCRLRRHPLSGELPASRPVAPVIVLPVRMLMQVILLKVTIMQRTCHTKRMGVLLYIVLVLVPLELFYYMGERPAASIVLLGRLRLLMIPALRRDFPSVVCEGRCKPSVVEHSLRAGTFVQCEGNEKAVRQARKAAARASLQACLLY